MIIDIRNLLSNKLTVNDILINDISTYPKDLQKLMQSKEFCEKDFVKYFNNKSNYNVIGVHFTRLFDYEIDDILFNGLHSDDTEDYRIKIKRMPIEFESYKNDLLNYVSNQKNKRSNGKIYFDIGKIEINDDNIDLLKYWGGETLYSYYTNPYDIREEFELLKKKFLEYTYPCMVILSMQAYKFFNEFYNNLSILSEIKSNKIVNYGNEHYTNKINIKVVNVTPINIS